MYLHIGQNVIIPEKSIIGIFDLDNTTSSHITRKFLSNAEKAGYVTNTSDELPNSFILCDDDGILKSNVPARQTHAPSVSYYSNSLKEETKAGPGTNMKIYLSQLSSQTLLKRSEAMRFE